MTFKQIINKATSNPKLLFLIDGFGALLSAFLLGVVLMSFESTFGMPREALYVLSFLPCVFAVYDFSCYFRLTENWGFFIKVIAIANLIYCGISIGFVVHHYQKLTDLGLIYFLLEFSIVSILVGLELKTAARIA